MLQTSIFNGEETTDEEIVELMKLIESGHGKVTLKGFTNASQKFSALRRMVRCKSFESDTGI